ncbi:MAG TPA: hypothetical protein VD996_04190 [Chitinophagaceae bacterium]|nr:hypothetical protein [Chitinophagaceae bacterium]
MKKSPRSRKRRRRPPENGNFFRVQPKEETMFFSSGTASQPQFFGNQRAQPIRVAQVPATVAKKKDPYLKRQKIKPGHIVTTDTKKLREMIVKALSDSKILSPYISGKLKTLADSKKSPIDVYDPTVFGGKYRKYANARGEKLDPSVSDDKIAETTQGFYEPKDNSIVLKTTSKFCHAMHEVIHSFSDPDWLKGRGGGSDLMEGLTQYFTDIVFSEQLGVECKDHSYGKQLACGKAFASAAGFEKTAQFFFNKDTSALDAVAAHLKMKPKKKLTALGGVCTLLKATP